MSVLNRLKQLDAYSKTLEDFKIKTFGGAASEPYIVSFTYFYLYPSVCFLSFFLVTLISTIIITLLFLSELVYYLSIDVSL